MEHLLLNFIPGFDRQPDYSASNDFISLFRCETSNIFGKTSISIKSIKMTLVITLLRFYLCIIRTFTFPKDCIEVSLLNI